MSYTKNEIEKVYTLTPMQEGMLFASLNQDIHKYDYYVSLDFDYIGEFNVESFKYALNSLIHNHDILRTVFDYSKLEKIVQIVLKDVETDIEVYDIKKLSNSQKNKQIEGLMNKDKIKYFDFNKGPLFRAKVFLCDDDSTKIILIFHHIIIDGWCLSALIKELFNYYYGKPVKKNKIEFEDYVKWITNNKCMAEKYWENILPEVTNATGIPLNSRSTIEDFEYTQEEYKLTINRATTNKLLTIAKEEKVTISSLIHLIWAVYLYKYQQESKVVFGSVVSGRHIELEEIDDLIGMCLNTIPVSIEMNGRSGINQLLQEVNEKMIDAQIHSHCALSELQKMSSIGNQLLSHILAFENVPTEVNLLGTEEFNSKEKLKNFNLSQQTNYDFCILVIPSSELTFTFQYNANKYNVVEVERLAKRLEYVIQQFADQKVKNISDISLILSEDTDIYNKMNENSNQEFLNTNLLDLIKKGINENRDKYALIFGERKYTYAELDEKSNQIADFLSQYAYEKNIAIYAERKPETIISIIGIMKAAKTYIPVVPGYPKERIDYIMRKSNTKIILDESIYSEAMKEGNPLYKSKSVSPNDNAYIIFTSGSTGQPKGVEVTHGGAANTVLTINKLMGITNYDRIMGFSSFCFDLSVFDIFGTLSSGAAYVFIEEPRDIFEVREIIEAEKITIWNSVPSTIELFVSNMEKEQLTHSLKVVMLSGDTISPGLPKNIREYFGEVQVWALGGSTEASIWSSGINISEWKEEYGAIPYGYPLENQKMFILDEDSQMCPVGIKGNLYIGGVGVAKGYCNDVEKTHNYFINDKRLGKIYKTGDTASLNSKGYIDFYGRKDNQIKIKGYRVELGEIENTVKNIKDISEAVAIFEKKNETIRLFYSTNKESCNENHIKDFLLKRLPEYMIPQCFVKIEKFPLNNNGKIDRQKLALLKDSKVAQMNNEKKVEEIDLKICSSVINIINEVLGRRINIDDSFFLNGGDSIKAIQLVSKLKKLGYKITIKEVFKNPTPAKISRVIRKDDMVLQAEIKNDVQIECSPIQKWFFENIGTENHWNQAIAIYREDGFDMKELERCLGLIVSNQDAFRIYAFKNNNGEYVLGLKSDNSNVFTIKEIYLDNLDNEKVIESEIMEAHKKISLFDGPLMNLLIFKTEHGDHLFITAHHIMIDGVSWRILVDNISELYGNTQDIILRSKTPFWKWNEELKKYAFTDKVRQELPLWEKIVRHGNRVIYPIIEENSVKDSKKETLIFDEKFTNKLKELSVNEYNGNLSYLLQTVLLSAYKIFNNRDQIQIWIEGHGREEILADVDIYDTIGWFTSLYPIFYRCFGQLELQKEEVLNEMNKIPNKGVGFGIINYLMPNKYKLSFPKIKNKEICFNYLGDMSFENGTLELSPINTGEFLNPDSKRVFMMDIVAKISQGKLIVEFIVNAEYARNELNSDFVKKYRNILINLINETSYEKGEE